MIAANTGITIDAEYSGGKRLAQEEAAASFHESFLVVSSETAPAPQPEPTRPHSSAASLLREYLPQVATKSSVEMVEAKFHFVLATGEPVALADFEIGSPQRQWAVRSRRERHAAVIALLEKWVADEMGDDKDAWIGLKKRIEESRTSTRKRFSD